MLMEIEGVFDTEAETEAETVVIADDKTGVVVPGQLTAGIDWLSPDEGIPDEENPNAKLVVQYGTKSRIACNICVKSFKSVLFPEL